MRTKSISISVIQDTRRPTKDGLRYPIMLRVTFGKKQFYFSLRKYVTESTWSKVTQLSGSRLTQEEKELKKFVDEFVLRVKQVTQNYSSFSREKFLRDFFHQNINEEQTHPTDVFAAFEEYCAELRKDERYGTAKSYTDARISIAAYCRGELHQQRANRSSGVAKTEKQKTKEKNSKLLFEEITPKFLKEYEQQMIQNGCGKSTIGMYVRALRAVYRRYYKFTQEEYPFGNQQYKIPTSKKYKRALDTEDLKRILACEPENDGELLAVDFWKTSFYCGGLNPVDMFSLNISDFTVEPDGGATAFLIRQKTKRVADEVKIHIILTTLQWNFVKSFYHKYENIMNLKDFVGEKQLLRRQLIIQRINKNLSVISKRLNIPVKITTYFARHSAATFLLRNNVPIAHISEMLGHKSILTTQTYLGTFDIVQKKEFAKVLDI